MFREVSAGNIPDGCAHERVGRKVSLSRQPDKTDSSRQPVRAPLKPSFVGIPVCNDAGEGKAGRCVSRGKRFATFPKFTSAAGFVRILAIRCSFQQQGDSVRGAHSFKRGPTRIRRIG